MGAVEGLGLGLETGQFADKPTRGQSTCWLVNLPKSLI